MNRSADGLIRACLGQPFARMRPGEIMAVYGGLVAAVGANSPILTECFPQGRTVFTKCLEGEVDDHLQILVTGLGHHGTVVPPAVLAKAQSLLTTWTGIYEAASTAKGAQKTTSLSRKELRTVLEAELFKNLLMLAILFPDDEVKAAQYCPKHLLETRASSVTPGAATLTLVNFNVETRQADMSIAGDGAETYRVLCKPPGEADFIVWAEDIEPVDGVATYSIGLNLAGTYEFVAEGVNGSRVGERSAVVSVG